MGYESVLKDKQDRGGDGAEEEEDGGGIGRETDGGEG